MLNNGRSNKHLITICLNILELVHLYLCCCGQSIVDPFCVGVLQNDWFFGSWDQDSYVPLEEGREDDEAPSNPSVSKMSCDDDGMFTKWLLNFFLAIFFNWLFFRIDHPKFSVIEKNRFIFVVSSANCFWKKSWKK